jgi:hypothetical protein
MNFESVEIFIFATDEHDSLIQTVHSIVSSCDKNDIKRILIIHPKTATESCLSAIDGLKGEFPGFVDDEIQVHEGLGGAISDSKQWLTASHVILHCADLAIDLSTVPEMINEEKNNPDWLVKTSRWLRPGSFHNYSSVKKFFNRIAQAFLRVLYHSKVTDFTNPVQIMPSETFKKFPLKESFTPVMLELVLIPVKMGVKIKELPTEYFGREEGKSKNSFILTILYMRTALRVKFSK